MGPNGSGKSTLAYAIVGHPAYEVTEGQILLDGEDITEAGADERAQARALPRVPVPARDPRRHRHQLPARRRSTRVRKARNGGVDDPIPVPEFRKELFAADGRAQGRRELASRYLNDGFSGGEKKRVEILQMAMLKPQIAVLDETDSGLDIDALKIVAERREAARRPRHGRARDHALPAHPNYIKPDFVHVFVDGRIVEEGGPELADKLEVRGLRQCVNAGNGREAA